ncbi:Mif2/CENP-C like-domain-containing protein [Cyathus striatus]|nr:Mif2/CENP-C like-domain-containing protein [Cyathus striatus]
MPSSARKSSLGAGGRRGPQKPHVPYRGDNPEVGKKTGIAVRHVERKSDGFEPFEEIMMQADKRTPPRPKWRKSVNGNGKRGREIVEEDEDGEMSMELDDSPLRYLSTARPPTTPRSSTGASTSRAVARTSDVDFDEIPSPRSSKNQRAQASNRGPGPSRLSRSFHRDEIQEPEPEEEAQSDDSDAGYGHSGMQINPDYDVDQPDQGFDDYSQQEDDTPRAINHSFVQMDADEEQEEQPLSDRDPTPTPPRKNGKGKEKEKVRPRVRSPSEDMEEDIAQGLMDVNHERHSDDEEEQEEELISRKTKRVKLAEDPKPEKREEKKPRQTASRGKKENKPLREGIRRSERAHIKPLEWWRGEKVVYGLPSTPRGPVLVAPIKEIVRIPKEAPAPLRPTGKKKRGRSKSAKLEKGEGEEEEIHFRIVETENPEEGWDDDLEPQNIVWDYETQREVQRRIAWSAKMVHPRTPANSEWAFDKIFGDGEFIAAGLIFIPEGKKKPTKAAKDNTYIFYVIEGAVNLKIHESSLLIATGGMFMVPRGNTYLIENVGVRTAKLFFTQARKIFMDSNATGGRRSSVPGDKGGEEQRSSTAIPVVTTKTSPAPKTKRAASSRV